MLGCPRSTLGDSHAPQEQTVNGALTGSATGTDPGEHSDAFDDADFPFGTVAQSGQRCLVAGAIMSGDSLLDTAELDQDGTLAQAAFVNLRRLAARQKASSAGSERRTARVVDTSASPCGPVVLSIETSGRSSAYPPARWRGVAERGESRCRSRRWLCLRPSRGSPAAGMRSRFTRSASPWFRRDASCEGRYVSSAAVAICASSNSANLSAVTALLK
jgi:hypothetical protein